MKRETRDLAAHVQQILSTPARLRRNSLFFSGLAKLVLPSDTEQRESGINDIASWLLAKRIERATRPGLSAAKGFAAELLAATPELTNHVTGLPHLGVLSELSPLPADRLEYNVLQLRILLELKQNHPTFGLGSSNYGIAHSGTNLSGPEIAQSWTFLTGYGHLFGTFSTERALLFQLDSDRRLQREFVATIDVRLQSAARSILEARDIYRFHYALAAWKISRWNASATRETSIVSLLAFISGQTAPGISRLRWTYRQSRKIAYVYLQSMLTSGSLGLEIDIESVVKNIRRVSPVGFLDNSAESPSALLKLVDAIDAYYHETFFRSPEASRVLLQHLREFRRWWAAKEDSGLDEKIRALAVRPHDWPSVHAGSQHHFCRLNVPDKKIGWPGEVREWIDARNSVWGGGNVLVVPSVVGDVSTVDIFVDDRPSVALLSHVAATLADRNEASWTPGMSDEVRIDLWRGVAGFGLQLLQLVLVEGRVAHLEPVRASSGIGLAFVARTAVSACGRLKQFALRVESAERRVELEAMHDLIESRVEPDSVLLVFLGTVRIVQKERQLKEIDGVFACIRKDQVEWHFMEHKSGDAAGMRRQLDDLSLHICQELPKSEVVSLSTGKAAICSLRWSGR